MEEKSSEKDLVERKKEIGKRIKFIRTDVLEKTQEEMQEILRINQSGISKLERGDVDPTIVILLILNEESGKTIDWILKGRD